MTDSWKYGPKRLGAGLGAFAALGAAVAFAGCSSNGDNSDTTGGAATGGSSAGKGGSGIVIAGTTATGGSGAGTTATGGSVGTGGTGVVPIGGSGGVAAGGNGGASGGTGGASGGTGGSGGKAGSGGTAGAAAGSGGAGGNGGSAGTCDDADGFGGLGGYGGVGGAGSVQTAIVLVDNIVVKDGAAAAYKSWPFADATDILDDKVGNVGDKWVRLPFDAGSIGNNAGAHDVFSKCGGNPAGSLKNVVPFTAAGQYYEIGVGFAVHDWSNYTVSADVKLVSGGNSQAGCAGHAELFINGAGGPTTGPSLLLNPGGWISIALTAPATGATMIDHLGVRITSYMCQ
jgi:hypothetical protein